jgi:pantoate ligase/cytidylate kinase
MATQRKPIVAIDGPAGAGKSTVAKLVAQQLGLLYLDTGAMYRAITLAVLAAGIAPEDDDAVVALASQSEIQFHGPQVWLNGRDITQEIRAPLISANVSQVAKIAGVRRLMTQQQQAIGSHGGVVMEGRDIGTQVFPEAEIKVFLTASPQERARRRHQDLLSQGQAGGSLEELEQSIRDRDHQDTTRDIAPLRLAADATVITSDGLSISQVVAAIVELYAQSTLQGVCS